MTEERREAVRVRITAEIEASIGGVKVVVLDLSAAGARIEHEARFSLAAPHLSITWRDTTINVPVRVARSEIAGRRDSQLIYRSGIFFTQTDPLSEGLIASIIREMELRPQEATPTAAAPQPAQPDQSLDDSWIRQVNFLRQDPDDGLPYAQYRLTTFGWQKAYVATPTQPDDGLTILRGQRDSAELQRTYENADPATRKKLQAALQAKLKS